MTSTVVMSDAKSGAAADELRADVLESYGVSVRTMEPMDEAELLAAVDGVDGLLVGAGIPVTETVIERADSLQVVGRTGIGVDNVDLDAARAHDVTVVHHPTYSIDEVATHALALVLAGLRRLPIFDRSVRAGSWEWEHGRPIHRLQGSTIGLLGFGKIPRRLATMLQGFGCTLLANDPYLSEDVIRSQNVEPVGFEELLSRVDVLSIHTPLTAETKGLIDSDALATLAEDAILVNTARGPVVDTDALVETLEADELDFACLDVTDPEPLPADHPLLDLEHALVTPHVAWYSEAAGEQLSREIAADVGRVLVGKAPHNEVTPETV